MCQNAFFKRITPATAICDRGDSFNSGIMTHFLNNRNAVAKITAKRSAGRITAAEQPNNRNVVAKITAKRNADRITAAKQPNNRNTVAKLTAAKQQNYSTNDIPPISARRAFRGAALSALSCTVMVQQLSKSCDNIFKSSDFSTFITSFIPK